ncbi:MAG: hypothetical protein WCL70_12160 [Paludibacter sp.]
MEVEIKNDELKHDPEANVKMIISDSLNLSVAESKAFTLKNIQALQIMVRTRFYQIKQNYGKVFTTTLNGNMITVTRYEDEVVR